MTGENDGSGGSPAAVDLDPIKPPLDDLVDGTCGRVVSPEGEVVLVREKSQTNPIRDRQHPER